MTARLLRFIRLLREQGVQVSVAESLDALHGVSRLGLEDRELLRLGLRTALVKSHRDFARFDELFERFFSLPRRRKRRGARPQRGQGTGQRPTPTANGNATRLSTPSPPLLLARPSERARTVPGEADASVEAPLPVEDHVSSQVLDTLAELQHAWEQQLGAAPRHLPSASPDAEAPLARTRLDRDFPPDDLVDMYHEVERLAARLLTRRALRYRRARHGRLDVRRTVLQGLRSGREVPFTLAYRRRRLDKLRLILLCDVSGSVWQVSTFLLKLVHTMQAEFTSVRSFLFVNSMVEVTPLFRHLRFPQDLHALRHYPNLNLFGFSDFGRAFYQVYRDLLGDLHRDTVILILGDARNNAFDPQAWTLVELRQRCRRLIWLNPEPQREWNKGDSVMAAYAPACDHLLECWTLDHLVQAADLLLQT